MCGASNSTIATHPQGPGAISRSPCHQTATSGPASATTGRPPTRPPGSSGTSGGPSTCSSRSLRSTLPSECHGSRRCWTRLAVIAPRSPFRAFFGWRVRFAIGTTKAASSGAMFSGAGSGLPAVVAVRAHHDVAPGLKAGGTFSCLLGSRAARAPRAFRRSSGSHHTAEELERILQRCPGDLAERRKPWYRPARVLKTGSPVGLGRIAVRVPRR